MEKSKYKKCNMWRPRAEALLLELWTEKISELRSAFKNGHTYKEMASVLESHNIVVSAEEVKSKVHNWSAKYRAEKSKIGASGGSPSDWEHYRNVHEILGQFKINNVKTLVEDSLLYEMSESQSATEPSSPMLQPSPLLVVTPDPQSLSETIWSSPSTSSQEQSTSSSKKGKSNFQNQLFKKWIIFKFDMTHKSKN